MKLENGKQHVLRDFDLLSRFAQEIDPDEVVLVR
jgi:hypothetical protein